MAEVTRRSILGGIGGSAAIGLAGSSMGSPAPKRRLVVDGLDVSVLNENFLRLLHQGGVHCVHKTVNASVQTFGAVYRFADQYPDQVTVAKSVADIRRAASEGKTAFVLGWQHAIELDVLLGQSSTYPPMVEALRGYHQLGLRVLGICYNTTNIFAGGCLDPHGPLTRAGRRLVEEVHKQRILLDLGGHTGERSSLDAIEISKGIPVVCTHTNMAALNPNMRCISDRLAFAIAASNGVIGLTAINDFHVRNPKNAKQQGSESPQASLDVHLDQYDYLKRLVGIDHIGLGSDFTTGHSGVSPHSDISTEWPAEESSDGPLVYIKDYDNISKLPNLIKGLQARGWSEPELDKLLGANWLRVYERVWGV